jgi:hypothetical protein
LVGSLLVSSFSFLLLERPLMKKFKPWSHTIR